MGIKKQAKKVEPKNGDLKVWWIPQLGINSRFEVPVASVAEAKLLLKTLADYDLFQLENRIKPDYSNTGGLLVYDTECPDDDGDCWIDWYNEEGSDIDNVDADGATLE